MLVTNKNWEIVTVRRTKTNLIQKALHNFYNSKMLNFVILTYADNMQDVKKAKKRYWFIFY